MEKNIIKFLEFIEKDKKLSSNTLESYQRDIYQFKDYIDENKIDYIKIEGSQIVEYLDYLAKINKKPSTISFISIPL